MFSTRKKLTKTVLNVDNEKITELTSMKYLCVFLDSKFDGEMKNILHRVACGIEVLGFISKRMPEKTKIMLLIANVMYIFGLLFGWVCHKL